MSDLIRIKRSDVTGVPPSLAPGEIAYSEVSGNFFYGRILDGAPVVIGGKTAIDKLATIESGAEVNTVDSVNGATGTVVLDTDDIDEGSTNLYYTNVRAVNAIKGDAAWNATDWDTAFGWGDHGDAGYALDSAIATVGKTGDYNDLTNKPDLSVLEEVNVYASLANFPGTGETGKVYIAEDTGYMYRWNGSSYTQMTDQTAIWGQISGTLADQTDLQSALNGKANSSHSHTAGDLPATLLYSGDNVSELDNDAGYITSAEAPVQSVAGRSGTVTLTSTDITNFTAAVNTVIGNASIGDLDDVALGTPEDLQVLTYIVGTGTWEPRDAAAGVTNFIALTDTPASFSGKAGNFVRVNEAANALEFVSSIDGGTF